MTKKQTKNQIVAETLNRIESLRDNGLFRYELMRHFQVLNLQLHELIEKIK